MVVYLVEIPDNPFGISGMTRVWVRWCGEPPLTYEDAGGSAAEDLEQKLEIGIIIWYNAFYWCRFR